VLCQVLTEQGQEAKELWQAGEEAIAPCLLVKVEGSLEEVYLEGEAVEEVGVIVSMPLGCPAG
jgi:hypothetical protein